jgi:hypothetical protein
MTFSQVNVTQIEEAAFTGIKASSLTFRNVNINSIKGRAFYNLTASFYRFEHSRIRTIQSLAFQNMKSSFFKSRLITLLFVPFMLLLFGTHVTIAQEIPSPEDYFGFQETL